LPHVGRHFIDGGSKRSRRSIVAILGACIELVKPFYRGPQLWKIQFGLVCKKTARCISDALAQRAVSTLVGSFAVRANSLTISSLKRLRHR
jgi:hypothetical protein